MAYMNIFLPTHAGAYWYRSEHAGQGVLLNICMKDGELQARYLNEDIPVSTMKGYWRGSIPPSTGQGSPTAS